MQFLINQIRIGGAIFVLPHFHAPADFVAAVVAARDAVVVATPDMCRALLAAAPADAPLLPGLRALISVGLPLYAGEKRQLAARVTPFLYDAFGAAGFGMIAALPPHEVAAMAETVGRSPAGAVVEVVDAAGGPLPPGVSGHLRCAGPTMAQGWLAPEDAGLSPAEAFSGGYYYSGDIASIDAAGYITLQGRRADVIRRAGAEIFPLEIEARMAAHAGVRDVAVVGRAGPGGEEIIAYVVPQGDLPHETLAAHCAQHLAPSHRPSVIYYTATLPRTGNGKLDRPALRALAARQAAL
jgi:acyl-coenzyme A synthetase/AMP-(fatty) acid ligase